MFSLSEMSSVERAAWLQAFATLVLVAVTIFYVRYTGMLVHAQHRAFVKPVAVKIAEKGWIIKLRNYGPGVVKDVRIRTVVREIIGIRDDGFDCWVNADITPAIGTYVLAPGEEAEYLFKTLLSFEDPFFIQWRTLTEVVEKTSWLIQIGQKDRVVPLSGRDRIRFLLKWRWTCLKSPYVKVQRWLYYRRKLSSSKRSSDSGE